MNTHWQTQRLLITFLAEDHAPQVLEFYRVNAEFRRVWSPIPPADFLTLAQQQNRLRDDIAVRQQDRGYTFWLFEQHDSALQTIIGFVSLRNVVRGAFQACHVGYELRYDYGGRGYMTEALTKVCHIAFDELKLHRLEANIMPRNGRSIKVAQSCGFVSEGLARKYLKINGVWEDHEHFVLLNDELE